MSYTSIKAIIQECSQGLKFPTVFDTGRAEDINITGQQNVPVFWLLPPTSSGSAIAENSLKFYETYSCEVFIFKRDTQANGNDATFQIVADCHDLAVNFQIKLADLSQLDDFEISAITKTPVYKYSSKILTGVSINFSISLPDDFVYCP
jgi:hypothetical protein